MSDKNYVTIKRERNIRKVVKEVWERKISLWNAIKVLTKERKISVWQISKSMTEEQFVELMEEYNNTFANEYEKGRRMGRMLQGSHRTLQGSVIRLLLGVLSGLGETKYTDARNELGIESCRKIKDMIERDEIKLGYMI